MTLLFMDSFACGDWTSRYTVSGTLTSDSSSPRIPGSYYLRRSGVSGATIRRAFTAASEVFIHLGFLAGSGGTQPVQIYGDSGATNHLTVMRNGTTGVLELRRGNTGGTLLASGSTAIPASTWAHLQIRATIADSGGICQVRLNGAATPEIDYTGDTKNGGTNTTIDNVLFSFDLQHNCVADVVICNASGSVNNTWLGDVAVKALVPDGNGNRSELTGSDADSADNYALVDELPFSATDYVGSGTDGHGDTYTLTDLPGTFGTVHGVQWVASLLKTDSGTIYAKRLLRSGSTDYAGTSITPSTSAVTYLEVLETDPATSAAWTRPGVNALEAGVQVSSS